MFTDGHTHSLILYTAHLSFLSDALPLIYFVLATVIHIKYVIHIVSGKRPFYFECINLANFK